MLHASHPGRRPYGIKCFHLRSDQFIVENGPKQTLDAAAIPGGDERLFSRVVETERKFAT